MQNNNRIYIYDNEENAVIQRQLKIEMALNESIYKNNFKDFYLVYQAKIDSNNKIVGMEALLRWNNGPNAQPAEFISITEDNKSIIPLGEWILKQALTELKTIQTVNPELKLSVNISIVQLNDNFIDYLKKLLSDKNIQAGSLELEILERAKIEKKHINILRKISSLGIKIAFDDFMDEDAGLNRILENIYWLDTVKFSRNSLEKLKGYKALLDSQLVNNIWKIAISKIIEGGQEISKILNKKITFIMEGVENAEEYKICQEAGFDIFQGYFYKEENMNKPVCLTEFLDFLRKSQ